MGMLISLLAFPAVILGVKYSDAIIRRGKPWQSMMRFMYGGAVTGCSLGILLRWLVKGEFLWGSVFSAINFLIVVSAFWGAALLHAKSWGPIAKDK